MDYSIERVAKAITDRREQKGMSQQDAARGANITRQTLSNYEGGVSGMSLENAWKLANFYGCTLDELGGRVMPGEAE
mgnify:CR=1 FL=1